MALEEIGIIDFVWPLFSLILLLQWARRTRFGKGAFDQVASKHLQLHGAELLAVLVVLFVSIWIIEFQSRTQEQAHWQFYDVILPLLCLALWIGPALLLNVKSETLLSAGKFGLFPQNLLTTGLRSLGYFVVAYGLTSLALLLTMLVFAWSSQGEVPIHDTLEKIKESTGTRPLVMLAIMPVFVAPLIEEIIFRGIIQGLLIRLFSGLGKIGDTALAPPAFARWLGIVIAAIIFASYHADWQHKPALFVLAVCMGYSYEKEDNLLVPILIHSLFNFISVLATLAAAPVFQ